GSAVIVQWKCLARSRRVHSLCPQNKPRTEPDLWRSADLSCRAGPCAMCLGPVLRISLLSAATDWSLSQISGCLRKGILVNAQRLLGLIVVLAGLVLATLPMFGPKLGGWHVIIAIAAILGGAMLALRAGPVRG